LRRWGHWTLRSRLVLVVGVLAAVALLLANVAGVVLIRSYLQDRIDDQLKGMTRPYSSAPRPDAGFFPRNRMLRLGPDQVVYLYEPDGTLNTTLSSSADGNRPPVEPLAAVTKRAAGAGPYTVAARDGSADWRLIAVANAETVNLSLRQRVAAIVPPWWMRTSVLWTPARCGSGPSGSGIPGAPPS
jgi:two-component system OmpR family sensor kinase